MSEKKQLNITFHNPNTDKEVSDELCKVLGSYWSDKENVERLLAKQKPEVGRVNQQPSQHKKRRKERCR